MSAAGLSTYVPGRPTTPLAMRQGSIRGLSRSGFHRMAYVAWGQPNDRPPVICVHGLTRNGRDFDRLAAALAPDRYVVCPDVVGRGQSDWLKDPAGYALPQYCADLTALIAHLGAEQVDWLGTSMGGLIGMTLAAQPGTPIRRLVLNDVGPVIPRRALERIAEYVGTDPRFGDLASLEAHLRLIYPRVGVMDDEAWHHFAAFGHRRLPDGSYGLAYDPAIATPFAAGPAGDVDLTQIWNAIRCPVLLLRGAESDLLLSETAQMMTAKAELVEFPGIGHWPPLMMSAEIETVRGWLTRP
ncbi:MAG TPA: alpha/beta hydrolase [Dongiaceae bacterium]